MSSTDVPLSEKACSTEEHDSQSSGFNESAQMSNVGDNSFPYDVEDPFKNATPYSDLVFIVEDRKMHVHKNLLSMHSPVFNVMLNSSCFVEKNLPEICLPGKKYEAMLEFLKQLYPVYSLEDFKDDTLLKAILPLAEEYQVEHVKRKCERYMESLLQSNMAEALGYLLLCEKYNISKIMDRLICRVSHFKLERLESNVNYESLQPATKDSIKRKRCLSLEVIVDDLKSKVSALEKQYLVHKEEEMRLLKIDTVHRCRQLEVQLMFLKSNYAHALTKPVSVSGRGAEQDAT